MVEGGKCKKHCREGSVRNMVGSVRNMVERGKV